MTCALCWPVSVRVAALSREGIVLLSIRYTGDDFSDRLLVDRKYRKQVEPLHMEKKQLLHIG